MKKLFFIFFTFSLVTPVSAQYKTLKARADKAFNDQNYYEAAYYYNLLAAGKNKSKQNIPFYSSVKKEEVRAEYPYIRYQLAESYRLYHDYAKAQDWYIRILTDNDTIDYPLTRLWYAVCLRAGKRFEQAITQLQRFNTGYKGDVQYIDMANREIADCIFARGQYSGLLSVEVKKLEGQWNTEGGNYALTKNGSEYWFTSSRTNGTGKNSINHIYRVSDTQSSTPVIIALNTGDSKNTIEYGSSFFDRIHKRLYVTGRFREDDQNFFAIYYTVLQNDQWSPLQKLNPNVNADGYNAIQPFVTPDGKRLFFASDKPGGVGGYDIWVSNQDADGNATDAINLGKTINTSRDDESPFYDVTHNKLNYSSKGFTGLGGFDVYESYENNGQWSAPVNLGYPVNSSKDDLYYFANPDQSGKFYISSDRESECCLSLFIGVHKPLTIAGTLSVCDTSITLAGVKVSLADSLSGKVLAQAETATNGIYSFLVPERKAYKLTFEKQGYFTKVVTRTLAANKDTLITENSCLESYVVNKPIVMRNILYDFNKALLRPESLAALDGLVAIMRDNPGIRIELSSHTDSIGSDVYNLNLSQQRAQSCVDYIVSKAIDPERIVAKGYGKSMPVAPNSMPDGKDNPAGRQLNRRTEFKVIGQKQ